MLAAWDSSEALQGLASTAEVAVVLFDPAGSEGPQTLDVIKQARPTVPVIVCSSAGDGIQAAFAGKDVAAVLQKPFTSTHMVAKIAEVLERDRQE